MSRVGSLHGTLILADHQLQGRGQYQRAWEADPSENLTFSLIFEPKDQKRLTVLTLACTLAVADVCGEQIGSELKIKWPNDVLYKNKKVCGILTEAIYNGSVLDRVIVGIGININQAFFSDELSNKATSLSIINKKKYSREQILASVLTKIEYYYRFWEFNDVDLVRNINNKFLGFGKWVRVSVNEDVLTGKYKFLGVNENGALVVLNKELKVDTFSYEQVRITIN